MASRVGVKPDTYLLWENDRARPVARYWPKLLALFGYDPLGPPQTTVERVWARRRALGLTMADAAVLAGVDEGTFCKWERGLETTGSAKKLVAFISPTVTESDR